MTMLDENGFPIYNYNTNNYFDSAQHSNDFKYLNRKVVSHNDGWLPLNKIGFSIDSNFRHIDSEAKLVTNLEYFLKGLVIPNETLYSFLHKTHGEIVHNNGCNFNDKCCGIDMNVCGIIAFFGRDILNKTCTCTIRKLINKIVGKGNIDYLIEGTRKNETLVEDHFDYLGKYFGVKVFIIREESGTLSVLRMGDIHSPIVKFIYANGVHFEEIKFNY